MRDARNSLFLTDNIGQSGQLSFQRPLLILLDRNFDLTTPLQHTWTYQALLHDLLDLELNRVEIEKKPNANAATTSAAAKESKTYDLLTTDRIWKQQKGSAFPVVVESIQEELEKYKQYEGELKSLKETIVRNCSIFIRYFQKRHFRNRFEKRSFVLNIFFCAYCCLKGDDQNASDESSGLMFSNTSKLTSAVK